VNASTVDLLIMSLSGLAGYGLRKFEFDVAPLILAVVLGERIEASGARC
jgi:TctA family transporter